MSGIWTVSISLASNKWNENSVAYIYFSGEKIPESAHGAYKLQTRVVRSSGERKVFLKASVGDTISIRLSGAEYSYNILACFEFQY